MTTYEGRGSPPGHSEDGDNGESVDHIEQAALGGPSRDALERAALLEQANTTPSDEVKAPRRSLTFFDGLAIVVGLQIGSGIFTSPAAILENIHDPLSTVLVWLAAGGLAWTGATCFIELGARMPRNGGIQEYFRYCLNDTCACMASWLLLLIVKPASVAMVALIFAEYLLGGLHAGEYGGESWIAKGIAIVAVGVFSLLNCFGTRLSTRVVNYFFLLKLVGLGSVISAGLLSGLFLGRRPDGSAQSNQNRLQPGQGLSDGPQHQMNAWTSAAVYTDAILAAMWAYSGWEAVRTAPALYDGILADASSSALLEAR